uniref:E3 ubiquitin-protein ligase RNF139-like n=1 Tax=Phallusia mammillata TaxID=59560 RepID=A0A6F9DQA8_9ASCI|nr:E3 ubiquitin-protein ligase RNF139-like [Phallusia mammillata]
MDYKVIDVLRSPTIIVLDTLLSRRMKLPWSTHTLLNFAVTTIGSLASIFLFSCHQRWLVEFYRFFIGLLVFAASALLQTFLVATCYQNYHAHHPNMNQSVVFSLVSTTLNAGKLEMHEIDLAVKMIFYMFLQLMLQWVYNSKFLFPQKTTHLAAGVSAFCACSTAAAVLLNVSNVWFAFSVSLTLFPQLVSLYTVLGKGISYIKRKSKKQFLDICRSIREQGLPSFIETVWTHLRVPQVLRLYFVFRLTTVLMIIFFSRSIEIDTKSDSPPQGIFYFFVSKDIVYESSDSAENISMALNATGTNTTNFYQIELLAVMLTDSVISVFCIGSAISVPFYYLGVELHGFVGGADLGHAESLGSVSAVLFCLLAIQTGLSGLAPIMRLVRLYRNVCLLVAAVMHYAHDLVHPVLMSLSAQANMPLRKHGRPLVVALFLVIVPTCFCAWLVQTKPMSTWLIALTAFSIELVVKVVATLLLYILYVTDARTDHKPWPHLDDWVFYIQSTSHTIEFICGCVMFVNGAYVLFFESGSALRAFMMSMHAYVNIYKAACDGLKTLNNRRTVNHRLSMLAKADAEKLHEHKEDVCSICYQNFSEAMDHGEVRITECKHLFHGECLRKWLYIQDTCPMCHQKIFAEDKKES